MERESKEEKEEAKEEGKEEKEAGQEELDRIEKEYEESKEELKEALQENRHKIGKEDRQKMAEQWDERLEGLVPVSETSEIIPDRGPTEMSPEAAEFDLVEELSEKFDDYFEKVNKYRKALSEESEEGYSPRNLERE